MHDEYDVVFILLDKIIEVVEKIYNWNKKEKKEKSIELGNLYTIKEEEEEDENCFREEFILVQSYNKYYR